MFKISIQRRKSLVNTHLKKNIAKINTITFMHTKSEFFARLPFVFGGLSEKSRNKVEFTTLKNLRCKENLHYIYEYEKNSICFCLQKRHLPTKSVFEAH